MKKLTNKKGFTLVEVIVVLVILAIMAGTMIPAMTGWIKKANERTAMVTARTEVLAAQTLVSESFGVAKEPLLSEIEALAAVDADVTAVTYDKSNGKIVYLQCSVPATSGTTVYYTPTGGYTTTAQTNPTGGDNVALK